MMSPPVSEQERKEKAKAAEASFREGKDLFGEARYQEALEVWARGYREQPAAFIESQNIQSQLKKLRKDSQKKKLATQALETHAKTVLEHGEPQSEHPLLPYFSFVLFDEGLGLECYDPPKDLQSSRARWQNEFEQLGEPLYARYRLAILDCLEGNLDAALLGLRFCEDRFPPKKHESLRLKALVDATVRAKEAIRAAQEGKLVLATPSAWESAGFLTPFEARPWKRAGLAPHIAQEFRDAGFTAKSAGPWAKAGFEGHEAARWLAAGIEQAESAKRWHRASVNPEDVPPWEKAFQGDVEKAILFLKAGFSDAAEAFLWSSAFQFPSDAILWKEQGFTAEEAQFWYQEAGMKDPYSARKEQEILSKPRP